MRWAFTPTSLRPTRDMERMFSGRPRSCDVIRITTPSLRHRRPRAYGTSPATGGALACRTWRTKRLASRFAVRQASSPWRANS